MTRNDKTPVAAGVCQCEETCLDCGCNVSTNENEIPPISQLISMGLVRHKTDIMHLDYTPLRSEVVALIDRLQDIWGGQP